MTFAALILAAAAATAQPSEDAGGAQVAQAHASVTILQAAVVRQAGGFEPGPADAPRPQISRRGGEVLIEFE